MNQLKAIFEKIYTSQNIQLGKGAADVIFLKQLKEVFPKDHVPKVNENLFHELYNSVVHQNKITSDEPILKIMKSMNFLNLHITMKV